MQSTGTPADTRSCRKAAPGEILQEIEAQAVLGGPIWADFVLQYSTSIFLDVDTHGGCGKLCLPRIPHCCNAHDGTAKQIAKPHQCTRHPSFSGCVRTLGTS
ncbi:hypothetical protein WJX74_005784 [Apatococcus lobatus]|uniref:Uncharacterized protein n=1 Tax=Apatococcus lobatus TaxID=904363 RepID=A0AAW1S020_9CHLO